MLELMFHFLRPQQVMKSQADKKRRDISSTQDDWVYVKLQPYRQRSLVRRNNENLTPRFYGPYKVVRRIGPSVYELQLPSHSRNHLVFHVSQLKQSYGTHPPVLEMNWR